MSFLYSATAHLTAKFHHPTFNRSEVIVRANKQTDAAENIHLAPIRYDDDDDDDGETNDVVVSCARKKF